MQKVQGSQWLSTLLLHHITLMQDLHLSIMAVLTIALNAINSKRSMNTAEMMIYWLPFASRVRIS